MRINFDIDDQLNAEIESFCKEYNHNKAQLVRSAIKDYIKNYKNLENKVKDLEVENEKYKKLVEQFSNNIIDV